MSFVSVAVGIGLEGMAANIAAGAMMGGSVKVGTNVLSGEDPFKDVGKSVVMGGLTGGLTPGVASAFDVSMPMAAGITQGGLTALATGDLTKGLMAGVGAYGMYGLTGAGQQAGLDQAMAGADVAGGEQVFGDSQTEIGDGSAGAKFNKYLTNPKATGAAAQANATGNFFKDNFKYMAAAAGPIMADIAAKNNMPQTVTQPGMIRPYSYDPYSGAYTAGNPYEATAKSAAGGGLMGMDDGGYNPGQLDFTQRSEPVVRMATGGVSDADIFKYFQTPNLSDTQIATDMQKYGVSAADIARATGTQDKQANYEQRFVSTLNAPTTDSSEFLKATGAVGLKDQALANAMQNAGYSQGAQYALTQPALSDAGFTGGIIDSGTGKAVDLYNQIGYTAGALPGDQGGLEGLYGNINYVTTGLQNLINTGKMSVADAQNAALAELARTKVSVGDVKAATGKDFGSLFKPKVDATQRTTTTVDKATDIDTAASTALPVGVSGAGITTINPNGTITTRPNIPGIPEGGFTGMTSLRDAYTAGGGSLGYTSPTYTPEEFQTKYVNKLTGGSKQSYDYLTGKTPYSATPATATGEVMKPYSESVLGIPMASSKKMYLFDPATKTYKINPDYAIPTYDKDGKKSLNLTNADVKTFMDKKPSSDVFYTWATTNNLSPEQIALASERPINEISKLFTGAKDLVGDDGKVDQTKVDAKTLTDEKEYFDEAAYLAAYPDVANELRTGKSASGQPVQYTSGYEHYLKYGKGSKTHLPKFKSGYTPPVAKAGGGLMNMAMARGGMAQQFDLGGYSDGGRLLRGPGDGVSDSIPATIGNKRPARLADGEFVVPARIVSELGNGSTEAGARKLYAMMDRVQAARRGTVGKGRVAKNSRADKHLPV
jgi:hypothetical protein